MKDESRREFLVRLAAGTAAGAGLSVPAESGLGAPAEEGVLAKRTLGRTGVKVSSLEFEELRKSLDPARGPLEDKLVGHLEGPTKTPEMFRA